MTIELIAYAREHGSRRNHISENGLSEKDGVKLWKSAMGIPDLALVPTMASIPASVTGKKVPTTRKLENQFAVAAGTFGSEDWEIVSSQTRSRLFKLFPFEKGFEALQRVNERFEARIINAGKTDKGMGYWITSKMPDYAIADEPTSRHLFTRSSADGSTPLYISAVATLPVCANTLAMASLEAAKKGNKIKHMAITDQDFDDRVSLMIERVMAQIGFFDWYKLECEKLAGFEATSEHVNALFDNVLFPMPVIKTEKAPRFVDANGNDLTVSAVQETREPIQVVRRNEARERYNEIVNAEFERRGSTLRALEAAGTGFVQYGTRFSNTKTDAVEKAIDFDFGNGGALKVASLEAIRAMAGIA